MNLGSGEDSELTEVMTASHSALPHEAATVNDTETVQEPGDSFKPDNKPASEEFLLCLEIFPRSYTSLPQKEQKTSQTTTDLSPSLNGLKSFVTLYQQQEIPHLP